MARKSRKAAASVAAVPAAPAAKVWRCAVYARLSCRNNGLAGDSSLRAQVDFVRDSLSGMEGVEVVGVYEDNGRTGTTFEGRAAFDALMDEVRAGAVDCIAVKDLSRFGRNMYETSTYLERIFPFLGVRFVAVNDGLDTLQGDGGIVVPFKGLVNEMYAVETSRKVSAVKHRQMEEGEVIKTRVNGMEGYFFQDADPEAFDILTWIDTRQNIQFTLGGCMDLDQALALADGLERLDTDP